MKNKLELINKSVKGFTNTKLFVGVSFLVFSLIAEFASFMLSIESLHKARHPDAKFGCDFSATVSCGKVAESWQAELLKFGQYSVPNAFLGMIFEAVFITIAVLLAFGVKLKLPKWFMTCSLIGNFGCVVFASWLFYQSSFVILVLCPWCLTLFFSTTFQFLFQLKFIFLESNFAWLKDSFYTKFESIVKSKYYEMFLILMLVLVIGFIVLDIITIDARSNPTLGI